MSSSQFILGARTKPSSNQRGGEVLHDPSTLKPKKRRAGIPDAKLLSAPGLNDGWNKPVS